MTATTWNTLQALHAQWQSRTLNDCFAEDPTRELMAQGAGITIDYSNTHIDNNTFKALLALTTEVNLKDKIHAMFHGEHINTTEDRAALHTLLRGQVTPDLLPKYTADIHAIQIQMATFVDAIHSGTWRSNTGERITDIVNIGIGGSDLGPKMVTEALKPYHAGMVDVHFLSNVDGQAFYDLSQRLNPNTTLFIVASKTFTTQETLLNASTAKTWLTENGCSDVAKHFVAVTTAIDKAQDFGINADNCFALWDWVGGRYSLWSAIGLPVALACGMDHFTALLKGAHAMDTHFYTVPLEINLPVILSLIGVWYINCWNAKAYAVLPYDECLSAFPAYLQQLDMESNGKSVQLDGTPVMRATSPVVWGSPGTNGQHAFHQCLHQGTGFVPVDFILANTPHHPFAEHHNVLTAHCKAQAQALRQGCSLEESDNNPHKVIAGNKPSTMITFEQLDPKTLGALVALYEHKVFVQSVIWNINAFDQFGVELGKALSQNYL
jgi:glucose-6-phosphate isomerase